MAFIGHGIRLWDAIAFLPVLTAKQMKVKYSIIGNELSLLASTRVDLLDSAARVLETQQGITLHTFSNDALKVNAQ
jgi:hypothetical protein